MENEYARKVLDKCLALSLALTALKRPPDPIDYLAQCLYQLDRAEQEEKCKTKLQKQERMNLKNAQDAFLKIIYTIDEKNKHDFLTWIEQEWLTNGTENSESYYSLRTIAEDIKTMMPLTAVFPSENIVNPEQDSAVNGTQHCIHVDAFLYEEDDIDRLIDEGKLSRNYCKDCHSHNISPITFLSHSASAKRIEFIFRYLLPDLKNKIILDIGSRLGAILYGGYYYTSSIKIIGVEMNEDLYKLQKHIVEKYSMNNRIEIICDDICNVPEIVRNANVIIMNNPFEFFLPKEEQARVWSFLRNHVTQPKTILVTVPSLEEVLSNLEANIDISTWLKRKTITKSPVSFGVEEQDEISEICIYEVL